MAKSKSAGPVAVATLKDVHIEGILYRCQSVVELSPDLADAHAAAGDVDLTPEAVAYLVGTGVELVRHVTPEPAAEPTA